MLHRDTPQSVLPQRGSGVDTEVQRDTNLVRTAEQLVRERSVLHNHYSTQHDPETQVESAGHLSVGRTREDGVSSQVLRQAPVRGDGSGVYPSAVSQEPRQEASSGGLLRTTTSREATPDILRGVCDLGRGPGPEDPVSV